MTDKEQRLENLRKLKTMSREEVAEFWDTHDFTDYFDLLEDVEVVASRARHKETFSFRMSAEDVERLRAIADAKGIGATTLVRMIVKEFLDDPSKVSPA